MILKRIQVATPQVGLKTNSYIVCDEKTKEGIKTYVGTSLFVFIISPL